MGEGCFRKTEGQKSRSMLISLSILQSERRGNFLFHEALRKNLRKKNLSVYRMAHDKRLVNINCSLFIQGNDFANSGEEQLWGWRGGDRKDNTGMHRC